MGALFKMYDDRQFCNGHRTVTMGMPMGYLVSGNYSQESNLQTIIEGRSQVGGNYLAGVATDEFNPDTEIDKMAAKLEYALENQYRQPQNFYGIGGMKIFRDLIWLMQGMMKADHRFYKANGHYDFPQKKKGLILKMYLVGALLSSPKIKAKLGNKMNEGMLMPYRNLFKELEEQSKNILRILPNISDNKIPETVLLITGKTKQFQGFYFINIEINNLFLQFVVKQAIQPLNAPFHPSYIIIAFASGIHFFSAGTHAMSAGRKNMILKRNLCCR